MLHPTEFYLPDGWAEPATARAFVLIVGLMLPLMALGFFVWSWRKHRRRAAATTTDAIRTVEPLRPGDVVISGKVADDDANPVSVIIEQRGKEWQGKGLQWSHRWREYHRTVEARPFYVVRHSGERVRVEPDQRVFLVDRLENGVFLDNDRRQVSARLTAGEPVSVIGTLVRGFDPQQGGYRDSSGLVLRPPARGRMLISTEPLIARHRARVRIHRNLTIATAGVLLLVNLLIFVGVNVRALFGHSVTATVTEALSGQTWVSGKSGGGHWEPYWVVNATGPDGRRYSEAVSSWSFRTLPAGASLPLLVAGPFTQVGSRATTSFLEIIAASVVMSFFLSICLMVLLGTRPWYDRRRAVTVSAGRLRATS